MQAKDGLTEKSVICNEWKMQYATKILRSDNRRNGEWSLKTVIDVRIKWINLSIYCKVALGQCWNRCVEIIVEKDTNKSEIGILSLPDYTENRIQSDLSEKWEVRSKIVLPNPLIDEIFLASRLFVSMSLFLTSLTLPHLGLALFHVFSTSFFRFDSFACIMLCAWCYFSLTSTSAPALHTSRRLVV